MVQCGDTVFYLATVILFIRILRISLLFPQRAFERFYLSAREQIKQFTRA